MTTDSKCQITFNNRNDFMKYLKSVKGRNGKDYVEALKSFNFRLLTLNDLQDIEVSVLMRSIYDQFTIDLYKYNARDVYDYKLRQANRKSYHETLEMTRS